jgi:hypothetical protein
MSRFQSRTGQRLHWRAIVRTTGLLDSSRSSQALAWHLVECADPADANSHCALGQQMLSTGADADGHCLIDGVCPRCALATASLPPPTTLAITLAAADAPPNDSCESPAVLPLDC